MKILLLSDINWNQFHSLCKIVDTETPTLILLAGDTYTDGLCPCKTHLKEFLEFLETREITTLSIKGNHDSEAYDSIFTLGKFQYIHEISKKYHEFEGLTFLGIPSEYFKSLNTLKNIKSDFPKPTDFIIAHPPTIRRIWLFDLSPKYIVVGHDDSRVCSVNNSLFLANNNSPSNYVVLNIKKDNCVVSVRDKDIKKRINYDFHGKFTIDFEAIWENNKLNWFSEIHNYKYPPHTYPNIDSDYGRMFEQLINLKKIQDKAELKKIINGMYKEIKRKSNYSSGELLNIRTPKALIKEYLKVAL